METHGSYTTRLKLRWTGSTAPPSLCYFIASASSEALGDDADASNGLTDEKVTEPNRSGPGIDVSSYKPLLKMLKPSKQGASWYVEMSNTTSAHASSSGAYTWAMVDIGGLSLRYDPRYAVVKYQGHETFRKGAPIAITSQELTTADGVTHRWTVPVYERIMNAPEEGVGVTTDLRADVGLPLMSYRLGPTSPPFSTVSFVGNAAWAEPGMVWFMNSSVSGGSASGTHDSHDPITAYLSALVTQPQVRTTSSGGTLTIDYLKGDTEKTDAVTFDVKWQDGVKGRARLNAHYWPEAKYVSSLALVIDPDKESPVDLPPTDGTGKVSHLTDSYEASLDQGSETFKYAAISISLALAAWQPQAVPYLVALAAAQKTIDAASASGDPAKFGVTRNGLPILNPGAIYPGTLYTDYDWVGTIQPETTYTPHEAEHYDNSGYLFNDIVFETKIDKTRGRRALRLY